MSTPRRALTYNVSRDVKKNRDPRVREGDMPEGMIQREIATADTTVVGVQAPRDDMACSMMTVAE